MKILHIMDWFMEDMGYEENCLPFCQAGIGNEVLVLCSKNYPKIRRFIKGSNRDIEYHDRALKIKRLKSLFLRFFTEQNWYFGFKKEIDSFEPDVIHLHHIWILPTLQFLVTNFTNKKKIRIFVDSHIDNGNFNYKGIFKFIYYFWFIKKIIIPIMLKRDFHFISVNPYSSYCLNTLFGIPKEKITLLPLGVDSERIFFSQEKRQALRDRYGIKNQDIVLAFSGIFEQNKLLIDLIAAFKVLAKKYEHIFLLLIGKGDLSEDIEFRFLKDKSRIILPGWQPSSELYQWYSMADIGVLSGKLGGIKDILAAGRPLIINDDLAVSYLIEYGNGLIFNKGDTQGLIRSMDTYIKNPDLIREHGEKSLRLVNDKLSWQKVALKSLQIYNEVEGYFES